MVEGRALELGCGAWTAASANDDGAQGGALAPELGGGARVRHRAGQKCRAPG